MKVFSAATEAIITSGQYLKTEYWSLTMADGSGPYYFTAGQVSQTIGGNLYKAGLVFLRDVITQRCGDTVGSLEVNVSPQFDYPGGPPLIAGGQFLAQARTGVLDGALWTLSKGFFAFPGSGEYYVDGVLVYTAPPAGAQIDTSPGLVPWWAGITEKIVAGRSSADVTLDEATVLLNIQMPRNVIQQGCVHTLFDVGCTMPKAQNTYSGHLTAVAGAGTPTQVTTSLTGGSYPNHFFDNGIIEFTSGVLSGVQMTVSYSLTSGVLQTIMPFASLPAVSDTFSIVPGCDKSMTMCSSGKFKNSSGVGTNNILHYRGCPFVPNPETMYDGGTGSQTYAAIGAQGTPGAGSPFTGKGR